MNCGFGRVKKNKEIIIAITKDQNSVSEDKLSAVQKPLTTRKFIKLRQTAAKIDTHFGSANVKFPSGHCFWNTRLYINVELARLK